MRVETDRLILRAPQARDVEDYLEFRNSEFVLRYNAMTPKTREETLAQFSAQQEPGSSFAMELKETGRIIGMIFTEDDSLRWGVRSKELSYFLGESYSRQGYMKEALRGLIAHLFQTEDLECVAARAFTANEASLRLLQSLGFHRDGVIPRCVKGYGGIVFDDALHSLFREKFIP